MSLSNSAISFLGFFFANAEMRKKPFKNSETVVSINLNS